MMQELAIEMINDEFDYDIGEFDCGEETLNTFLKDHLKRQHDGQILKGYVLVTKEQKPKLLGYYTLSGSCFERKMLPSKHSKEKSLIRMRQALLWDAWLLTNQFKVRDGVNC